MGLALLADLGGKARPEPCHYPRLPTDFEQPRAQGSAKSAVTLPLCTGYNGEDVSSAEAAFDSLSPLAT